MWTPVWLDALLGYGTGRCEECSRRYSARRMWLAGQMKPTSPTSARLAYCRRCAADRPNYEWLYRAEKMRADLATEGIARQREKSRTLAAKLEKVVAELNRTWDELQRERDGCQRYHSEDDGPDLPTRAEMEAQDAENIKRWGR